MSFALTTEQIRNRTKTVTRRIGWRFLQPGDFVRAVVKAQGLKKGERVTPLAVLKIEHVAREPLDDLAHPLRRDAGTEVCREGFPLMSPREFVEFFARSHRCHVDAFVTRIEFSYVQ